MTAAMSTATPTVSKAEPPSISVVCHTRHVVPGDLPQIERLHALVFGPGRFARTAYRVREGTPLISAFCRIAEWEGRILASLRMTLVSIGSTGPHLLLGPLAVDPAHANQGLGRRLITEALADGRTKGIGIVTLVGDTPYYGRFGFAAVKPGKIVFPGPVNPARILACELTPGALETATGLVTARETVSR